MDDFDAYSLYISLKNHFCKTSYDHFKYNGKSNLKRSSFDKRKDKVFFLKLAKHKDVKNFLISNLVENDKLWIKDLAYSEDAEKIYKDWLKRNQALTHRFKTDLSKLHPDFNNNFVILDNQHPILLRLFLRNDISVETFCILLQITGAMKHWNTKLEYDLIWDSIKLKVEKYTPFIDYDKEKVKKIVLDYFAEVS